MEFKRGQHPLEPQEIDEIENSMTKLMSKIHMDNSLTYLSKDNYNKIHSLFKKLDTSIYNHKEVSVDTNDRLDELTDVISSIANLDFSHEAQVKEEYNHLDYIAISINLMKDRLEEKISKLSTIKAMFNALPELYIITDASKKVLFANQVIENTYNVNESLIIGKHIDNLFGLKDFKGRYSLHSEGIEGFSESSISNDKEMLMLSCKTFFMPNHEEGFIYKIIPLENKSRDLNVNTKYVINDTINFITSSTSVLNRSVVDLDNTIKKYEELSNSTTLDDLKKQLDEVNKFKGDIAYDLVKDEIAQAIQVIDKGLLRLSSIVSNSK